MKRIFLGTLLAMSIVQPSTAQSPYLEEVKALGIISGQGMACSSSKHPTFEMLARAIMLTKAPNEKMLNEAAYIYSDAKANTYLSKQMDGYYQCNTINKRFEAQDIFKITLYADGTLKMPNGQIITPRQPYDASQLYVADKQIEIKAKAIYEGAASRLPDNIDAPTITSVPPLENKQNKIAAPSYNNFSTQDYTPSAIGHLSRNR